VDPERAFTDADREAVRAAVAAAERETGGEVVPYVVGRCGEYRAACWAAAALAAAIAAGLAALGHDLGGFWGGSALVWVALPVPLAALAGYALTAAWPWLRRRLTPPAALDDRIEMRAAAAFLETEAFATRDRTGVLIFLALFERRVVILGDSGIAAKVAPAEWKAISDRLAAGIRRGEAAPALVEAIAACGRLLVERRVERRPDDRAELSDELRMRDE
jgi:putative membrane protein